MILRNLIRQIIKESLISEKYKEGDAMIGSLSNIVKDFEKTVNDEEEEDIYSYDNSQSSSSTSSSKQQKDISSTPLDIDIQDNKAGTTFKDKQVRDNHIQFKEGYEVYIINEKKIGIKNLNSSTVHNYKIIYIAPPPLTIIELKMENGSASLTASKAGLKKTVVLTDLNKQAIVAGFENNEKTFKVKGKTTDGETGTVKFIKVS